MSTDFSVFLFLLFAARSESPSRYMKFCDFLPADFSPRSPSWLSLKDFFAVKNMAQLHGLQNVTVAYKLKKKMAKKKEMKKEEEK